ncbi:hypothetical protein D3C78_1372200 [compost metagenome]
MLIGQDHVGEAHLGAFRRLGLDLVSGVSGVSGMLVRRVGLRRGGEPAGAQGERQAQLQRLESWHFVVLLRRCRRVSMAYGFCSAAPAFAGVVRRLA